MTTNIEEARKRLVGWKAIARHLGRSERAVQFWEEQRGLPIHRIPGTRGHTVYAYVAELDAWMAGPTAKAANDAALDADLIAPVDTATTRAVDVGRIDSVHALAEVRDIRPPGILVLPVERRPGVESFCSADALCQQLIVRLSAMQPVRVLSWTTSRSIQQSLEPIAVVAQRLNARYFVESDVERGDLGLHIDVRIVDAEIDHIVLADRFVVSDATHSAGYAELAECVALHFALIHAGALVEPICVGDLHPMRFLAYLGAVRTFFNDVPGTSERTLSELDRALELAPDFVPAQALRGLALVQRADSTTSPLFDEARTIFAACHDQIEARVTTAFLGAALARRTDAIGTEVVARMVLRWIPPASGRSGRLYERRSALRRPHGPCGPGSNDFDRRSGASNDGHPLIDALLRTLVQAHDPQGNGSSPPRDRTLQPGMHPAGSVSELFSGRPARREAER